MSRTRTTTDSPREITDPKRRSYGKIITRTTTDSPREITRSYGIISTRATPDSSREKTDTKRIDQKVLKKDPDPSGIDSVLALLDSIPPIGPLPVGKLSPIDRLIDDWSVKRLAAIFVNSAELVEKAKAAKLILEDGIPNSDQGVEMLSNVVHGFWRSECFLNSLCTAEECDEFASLVVHYANQDSPHQRWKLMKEDPLFKPYLTSLDSPATSNSDIVRLFLTILIGYWGDKAMLTNLDDAMGKAVFGRWLTIFAHEREFLAREKLTKVVYVEKREVNNFIYLIKDADDSKKNLKQLVQEWLVSTYGNDKNVNTDALLEEIQSELSRHLEISCFYDGKKAKIHIQVLDGLYAFVNMDPMCKM